MDTAAITSIAFFHAKPGQEASLGALLAQLSDSSPTADGLVDCVVHQSPDSPELWFVYETWSSEAELQASFDSERLKSFVRAAAPLLRCDMQLGLFTPVRSARDRQRAAASRKPERAASPPAMSWRATDCRPCVT